MIRLNIVLLFVFLFATTAISQDLAPGVVNTNENKPDTADFPYWIHMMQDRSINFYKTVDAYNQYFSKHEKVKGSGYKQFERWKYLMKDRINPDGTYINADKTLLEYQKYKLQYGHTKSANGSWTEVGPINQPESYPSQPNGLGRLNAIAFHPTNADIIYVGAPSGGLWKTIDGGKTWVPLTDDVATLGVSSILIHPTNPDIIYIGTGDRDSGDAEGLGVYKSTDGGETWTAANTGMGNVTVGAMVMDPDDANTILAACNGSGSDRGIYKTTNGGTSWTQKLSAARNIKDIVLHPTDYDTIYATQYGYSYLLRSINGGENWSYVSTDEVPQGYRAVIGVSEASPDVVYVLVADDTDRTYHGIYKSTDAGATFTEQSTSPNIFGYETDGSDTRTQATYDLCIAVDPEDANTVYCGAINIWKSTDGGVNWTCNAHWVGDDGLPAVHADQHVFAYTPHDNDKLFVGNDGGFYYTTNGGTTWSELSSGLAIAQVYKIGQSSSNKNTVINGYQDNGTAYFSSLGWNTVIGGDGMECIMDASDTNIMFGALYYGDIRRSTDGGFDFDRIADEGTNGIDEDGDWVTPYIIHEGDSSIMFIGYDNVWKSTTDVRTTDAESITWDQISSETSSDIDITVLEHSPADNDIFYYAREDSKLYRSDNVNDGTPSWTDITANLPNATTPTDLEAHPTTANTIYMTQSNKVYKSTNKGVDWTDISGTLPDITMNCIVFDENSSGEELYVGTDAGVYYYNGSSWSEFRTGLPVAAIVTELEIYYDGANSVLRAATYGRGLWQTDLYSSAAAPEADFRVTHRGDCAPAIYNFFDQSIQTPTSWEWTFSPYPVTFKNGTSKNSQNPHVEFSEPGSYTVKLVVANGSGSDSIIRENYLAIGSATANPCDPTISNIGNYDMGVYNFKFNTINKSSERYGVNEDFTCTNTTVLVPGETYNMSVTGGTTYAQDYRVFIDYDNDGSLEAGEIIFTLDDVMGKQTQSVTIPDDVVTGVGVRLRVIVDHTTYNSTNACNTIGYGQAEDYTVVFAPYTWTGNTNTDWNTTTNWSPNALPDADIDVVIPSEPDGENFPLTNSGANGQVRNLIIEPEAQLTVPAGKTLTVNNDLRIKSDASGTGSLIDAGTLTVTGDIAIEKYLTGTNNESDATGRWWYVSSPTATTSSVFHDNFNYYDLHYYDETIPDYTEITNNSTSFTSMKGYASRIGENGILEFTGELHTGAQSIAVTNNNNGYNLVGNPYPSAIDWKNANWTKTNIGTTIWYRTNVGEGRGFATFNSTGDVSANGGQQYIPAMQAFWVKASDAGTVGVTNDVRVHNDQSFYKNNKSISNLLRLRISSNNRYYDETVIYFPDQGSFDINEYDSEKKFSSDKAVPELFTVEQNGEKLVINALPPFEQATQVPLGVQLDTSGMFTITAEEMSSFNVSTEILLEDLEENIIIDLKNTSQYSFISSEMNNADRFVIHFNPEVYTDVDDNKEEKVMIYSYKDKVYLNMHNVASQSVSFKLFNLQGKLLLNKEIDSKNRHIESITEIATGFYLVQIITSNQIYQQKVHINKN